MADVQRAEALVRIAGQVQEALGELAGALDKIEASPEPADVAAERDDVIAFLDCHMAVAQEDGDHALASRLQEISEQIRCGGHAGASGDRDEEEPTNG